MMKTYYMLVKPGIIFANALTTGAGFFLASKGTIDFGLFLAVLAGLSLVVASAGVFNNYLDKDKDAQMERTKNRPLVQGLISSEKALIFASFLGLAGLALLLQFTNLLTVGITVFGFFVYLVLYAFYKYHSFYGTLVGSVAGAVPPVIGYCAVTNQFDVAAVLLFLILVLWQMPHFFAIAMYRFQDYSNASIPVLPVEKGFYITKVQTVSYVIAFTVVSALLSLTGYTGYIYLFTVCVLGAFWLNLSLKGFKAENNTKWAKQMFLYSLVVIMAMCFTISVDYIPNQF